MNLYKYDGESSRKNISDATSNSSSSNSSISGNLWGNDWSGGSVDSTIYTNGNIFIYGSEDNEDEEDDDSITIDTRVPRDEDEEYLGCLFADDGLFAKRAEFKDYCYANEQYVNYPDKNGVKTNILDLFKQIVPVGSIIMHNGQTSKDELLSYGWAICDGTNGTPNLKDKFIKGVISTSAVGSTGGTSTHTLTVEELPSHNHSATTNVDLDISREDAYLRAEWKDKFFIGYKETFYQTFDLGGDKHYTAETGYEEPTDKGIAEVPIKDLLDATGNVTGTATANTTIGNTGNGESFNIEPPYYTLIYICRIK